MSRALELLKAYRSKIREVSSNQVRLMGARGKTREAASWALAHSQNELFAIAGEVDSYLKSEEAES